MALPPALMTIMQYLPTETQGRVMNLAMKAMQNPKEAQLRLALAMLNLSSCWLVKAQIWTK